MKRKRVELHQLKHILADQCPFINFAWLNGTDENGQLQQSGNLELFVFLDNSIGVYLAMETILPIVTRIVPQAFCDLVLLNRVDPITRYHAVTGPPFFVKEGKATLCRNFVQKTSLEYRIVCAQYRRRGQPIDHSAASNPGYFLQKLNENTNPGKRKG